jgi:hypothetical protein
MHNPERAGGWDRGWRAHTRAAFTISPAVSKCGDRVQCHPRVRILSAQARLWSLVSLMCRRFACASSAAPWEAVPCGPCEVCSLAASRGPGSKGPSSNRAVINKSHECSCGGSKPENHDSLWSGRFLYAIQQLPELPPGPSFPTKGLLAEGRSRKEVFAGRVDAAEGWRTSSVIDMSELEKAFAHSTPIQFDETT